ncbi:MAG TPA: nucleoside hydrolase [Chloroflexi bacterium]|nr:nucleoside hydrolase [Chloroflexota bacterium]
MQRMIIDTDPGVDDAHAIMMAFAHPDAQIEALTTVAGNVSLERTTANACTILDMLGKDVPIYAGCQSAFIGADGYDAAEVHGKDGLGDAGFPPSQRRVEAEHASQALVRLANESPGEITLVTIGPLTNVAVALKLDPDLPQKFKKLVAMGGAIRAQGNTPNLSAEFNFYSDPEAAHIVFEAWPELTLISWETTVAHGFSQETLQTWLEMDTPRAEFFKRITRKTIDFITALLGHPMLFGADALALAVALEPDIVEEAEKRHVTIELHGQHTRGQTVVDWMGLSGRTPNTNIILKVNYERFLELMTQGLA